jgi:inosine/xanthosine triphosphatase
LQVVVGTANPIKVKAVENVLSRFFKVTVCAKDVPSQVSPQPVGLGATVEGAIARAKNALAAIVDADLGVGVEAGLIPVPGTISGYLDQQFACIIDKEGRITLGGGPSFEYPSFIVSRVLSEAVEVGVIMGELTGIKDLGRKQGAIGYFSKGQMDRMALTEQAVLMALIPRLNEDLYLRKDH